MKIKPQTKKTKPQKKISKPNKQKKTVEKTDNINAVEIKQDISQKKVGLSLVDDIELDTEKTVHVGINKEEHVKRIFTIYEVFENYFTRLKLPDTIEHEISSPTGVYNHSIRLAQTSRKILLGSVPCYANTDVETILVVSSLFYNIQSFRKETLSNMMDTAFYMGTANSILVKKEIFPHLYFLTDEQKKIISALIRRYNSGSISFEIFRPDAGNCFRGLFLLLISILKDAGLINDTMFLYKQDIWMNNLIKSRKNVNEKNLSGGGDFTISSSLLNLFTLSFKNDELSKDCDLINKVFSFDNSVTKGDIVLCCLSLPAKLMFSSSKEIVKGNVFFNDMVQMLDPEDKNTRMVQQFLKRSLYL